MHKPEKLQLWIDPRQLHFLQLIKERLHREAISPRGGQICAFLYLAFTFNGDKDRVGIGWSQGDLGRHRQSFEARVTKSASNRAGPRLGVLDEPLDAGKVSAPGQGASTEKGTAQWFSPTSKREDIDDAQSRYQPMRPVAQTNYRASVLPAARESGPLATNSYLPSSFTSAAR